MLRKTTVGRPVISAEIQKEIKKLTSEGYSQSSIAKHLCVSRYTVQKYGRESGLSTSAKGAYTGVQAQ